MKDDGKLPMLKCRVEGIYYVAWCPYCRVNHRHGAPENGGRTHRIAHCVNPDSPFRKDGYLLEPED